VTLEMKLGGYPIHRVWTGLRGKFDAGLAGVTLPAKQDLICCKIKSYELTPPRAQNGEI